MLWNEARMSRISSGMRDSCRGRCAKGSTSGVRTSRRTGSTTASRPMGRKSLPLGDVGEWHLKKTRGPSFDGEGRGDGHDMRPTCRASTSSRLRRGLRGGKGLCGGLAAPRKGLCGGLATLVAIGPLVAVSALGIYLFFLDRLPPN
jgi:hypothetical protein